MTPIKGLSKKNQKDWINAIKLTKETKLESNIAKYLRRSFTRNFFVDVPCFIEQNDLEYFLNTDFDIPNSIYFMYGKTSGIKQLTTTFMQQNLNNEVAGETIMVHASGGYLDVKMILILAPLIYNYVDELKRPIELAAIFGRTEIVKILAPIFCANPNNNMPNTLKGVKNQIKLAASYGISGFFFYSDAQVEIIKIITSYI